MIWLAENILALSKIVGISTVLINAVSLLTVLVMRRRERDESRKTGDRVFTTSITGMPPNKAEEFFISELGQPK